MVGRSPGMSFKSEIHWYESRASVFCSTTVTYTHTATCNTQQTSNTIRLFTIYLLNLQFYNNLSLRNSVYQSGVCVYTLHCRKNGVVGKFEWTSEKRQYMSTYDYVLLISAKIPHGYRKTCVA